MKIKVFAGPQGSGRSAAAHDVALEPVFEMNSRRLSSLFCPWPEGTKTLVVDCEYGIRANEFEVIKKLGEFQGLTGDMNRKGRPPALERCPIVILCASVKTGEYLSTLPDLFDVEFMPHAAL